MLVSDSMFQAVKDGKDKCVMITDSERFFEIISRKLDNLIYMGVAKCEYTGRQIDEQDPTENSLTNRFLMNPAHVVLLKPEKYKKHREVRAVWAPKTEKNGALIEPIIQDVKELKELCIEIDFDEVDIEQLRS